MKVTGPGSVGRSGAASGARPAGGGAGFRLPGAAEAAAPAQSSGVASANTVMGVDALLTLQDVGGPLERRRRAVNRAGRLLDRLDELKLALLDGRITGDNLTRLQLAIREQRAATDDPRLESLLDEIETRALVELAKLERARAA
jgi:hypothetical protein